MSAASLGLYDLTEGQGQLKEILVSLPKSWEMETCLETRKQEQVFEPVGQVAAQDDADFVIGGQVGVSPQAEQHGGCGVQGLRVRVPMEYFRGQQQEQDWNARQKGRAFGN